MDAGVSVFLTEFANSKLFVGFTMLVMNLGSRYIMADMTQAQQSLMASEIAKKFIVFCMFFVPTRDIMVSVMLTFAFFFLTDNVLNEKKSYSLVKGEEFKDGEEGNSAAYKRYVECVGFRK